MTTLIKAAAQNAPKNIVNGYSTSGYVMKDTSSITQGSSFGKFALSGAMVAGVLKSVLSIAGAGALRLLSVQMQDATSRTLRARITIDGTVVFDSTSAANAAAWYGAILIGSGPVSMASPAATIPVFDMIQFNSSLLVEFASSLTESDKINIGYKYVTY